MVTKLTLPASVNDPATSTPNVSAILGNAFQQQAASTQHQPLPGAISLPPPGLATAGAAQPGQRGFYKPYREQDYPKFSGLVEEYGGWMREWKTKILPWLDTEVALRELNRCTPKNLDLSIYDEVDQVLRGTPVQLPEGDLRVQPGQDLGFPLSHPPSVFLHLSRKLGIILFAVRFVETALTRLSCTSCGETWRGKRDCTRERLVLCRGRLLLEGGAEDSRDVGSRCSRVIDRGGQCELGEGISGLLDEGGQQVVVPVEDVQLGGGER